MVNIRIPTIPTREARFENGTLQFNIMSGCAYNPDIKAFTGGAWVNAHIRTKENEPVWVKLEGAELVIVKMTDYVIDKSTGYFVGGKTVEIARFNICE